MRILILGASDSEGTLLANFGDSWRELVRLGLPQLIGEPVEVFHKRYYVHLPGTMAYLERCIEESQPDFVLAPCTAWSFSAPSVGNRLRRLLGKRAGDWFERRFTTFDDATAGGQGGWRDRANGVGHTLAGKVIGREGISTYDHVLAMCRQTIERIARIEDADCIVMGTTYNGPEVQRRVPGIRNTVDRFNRELRETAEARHFGWIDRQAIISGLAESTARPDQMHTGEEVHAAYAEAVTAMIAARVRQER